jgi:hypothetical protein
MFQYFCPLRSLKAGSAIEICLIIVKNYSNISARFVRSGGVQVSSKIKKT